MAITYRQGNDGRLSVEQMDGNFSYIEDYLQSLTASLASLGNLDVSGLTASIMMLEEEIAGVTASALFKGDNLFDWSQDGLQDVLTLKNVNVNSSISFSPYVSPGQPSPWVKFIHSGKRGIISYYDGQFGIISDSDNGLNRIQLPALRTFTQSSDAQASGLSSGELYKTANGTLKIVGNDAPPTYKVYTAKVEMSDGSATVFQNTLGAAVSWATASGEITTGTIGALIGQNNVYVQVSSSTPSDNNIYIVSGEFTPSPWKVKVKQTDNTGSPTNTQTVYVEIRVYN